MHIVRRGERGPLRDKCEKCRAKPSVKGKAAERIDTNAVSRWVATARDAFTTDEIIAGVGLDITGQTEKSALAETLRALGCKYQSVRVQGTCTKAWVRIKERVALGSHETSSRATPGDEEPTT
jgi:hypothetical protein